MHMFSGRSGHPQGVGPYVMAQSLDKSFVVQVCHRQVKRGISINNAMAVNSSYGMAKYVGGKWSVAAGSRIQCSGATCRFPSGEVVSALAWVSLPWSYCGNVQGMCGNYNPEAAYADVFTSMSFSKTPRRRNILPARSR